MHSSFQTSSIWKKSILLLVSKCYEKMFNVVNVTQPYWQAASPTAPTSNLLIPDPSWSQGETQRFNLCCLQLCRPSFPRCRRLQTQHRRSHSVYQTKAFKMSIIIIFFLPHFTALQPRTTRSVRPMVVSVGANFFRLTSLHLINVTLRGAMNFS